MHWIGFDLRFFLPTRCVMFIVIGWMEVCHWQALRKTNSTSQFISDDHYEYRQKRREKRNFFDVISRILSIATNKIEFETYLHERVLDSYAESSCTEYVEQWYKRTQLYS